MLLYEEIINGVEVRIETRDTPSLNHLLCIGHLIFYLNDKMDGFFTSIEYEYVERQITTYHYEKQLEHALETIKRLNEMNAFV
jgi:hypothetical protein